MIVRDAAEADMAVVCDLYNALIRTTTGAWTETLQTLDERLAWFAGQQQRGHPVLVADDGNAVVGFTSYESFRGDGKWPGYRFTVEHTIHVTESHWGVGIPVCQGEVRHLVLRFLTPPGRERITDPDDFDHCRSCWPRPHWRDG